MDKIDSMIEEVLKELEKGIVKADINYRMKIHRNASSDFELTPTIHIKKKEEFYNKIKEYVALYRNTTPFFEEEEENIKGIIAKLFANMSICDFNDPENYIERIIAFRKNRLLEDTTTPYIEGLEGFIEIKVQNSVMETPFSVRQEIVSGEDRYLLPTISYGIAQDTCYIYAIQDYNKHEKTPYHNKITRRLYKVNHHVFEEETEEYKSYKEGKTEEYPENISDVSPGALLALINFLKEIENFGIKKVQVIPYLPVRYENKIRVLAFKTLKKAKEEKWSEEQIKKYYLELVEKQRKIQSNITEKFIRTVRRAAYHFKNIHITSYPMELDDCMHITLLPFEYSNNDLLNEIIKRDQKRR